MSNLKLKRSFKVSDCATIFFAHKRFNLNLNFLQLITRISIYSIINSDNEELGFVASYRNKNESNLMLFTEEYDESIIVEVIDQVTERVKRDIRVNKVYLPLPYRMTYLLNDLSSLGFEEYLKTDDSQKYLLVNKIR